MLRPRAGGRSPGRTPPAACLETERDGEIVRHRDEPETGFRRRFVSQPGEAPAEATRNSDAASDRTAPVSSIGAVEGLVLPISSRVSGELLHFAVSDDEIVEAGTLLFEIDPTLFRLGWRRPRRSSNGSGSPAGRRPRTLPPRRRESPGPRRCYQQPRPAERVLPPLAFAGIAGVLSRRRGPGDAGLQPKLGDAGAFYDRRRAGLAQPPQGARDRFRERDLGADGGRGGGSLLVALLAPSPAPRCWQLLAMAISRPPGGSASLQRSA